jgi:hypothetical protein
MANPTIPGRQEQIRTTGTPGQTVSETASSLGSKAQEMASSAGQSAREMATDLSQGAEHATTAVGSKMRNLAGSLRESLPHEGMIGTASSAVADTIDRGGRYLEQEGLSGLAEDLTNVIRRNPIPALLVGIGVGFLLGRTLRR